MECSGRRVFVRNALRLVKGYPILLVVVCDEDGIQKPAHKIRAHESSEWQKLIPLNDNFLLSI